MKYINQSFSSHFQLKWLAVEYIPLHTPRPVIQTIIKTQIAIMFLVQLRDLSPNSHPSLLRLNLVLLNNMP